ncbi:MAG: VOC family protein [Gammaproteobacteria bacterium]|nr:VOC family protein [Gammaproteobacteria bacterium]MYF59994.1 VOC family protein [Gammaproteobacteria bacterium]
MRSAVFGILVLLVAACSPGAGENQEADGAATADGDGPAGEALYDGVLFRRGNIVVSDLDRAYTIWIDLFGMEIDTENVPDSDSLSYDLFNVPNTAPTRFATLNAGLGQSRTLGIYEVPGLLPDEQDRIRRGAVVINANGRLDAIRDALPGLGLSMLREKRLVTVDQQVGIETGFHDWDGNLIVLYELEGAQSP